TRLKKYSELIGEQKLQDDCDVQATNIILHGLPPDVYALVNHQEAAKAIWDKVKLLMKGTELSYQERECRLMTMLQVQVNTKFLNALPPKWSKFVTDVKLSKIIPSPMISYMHTSGENSIDCINKALAFMSDVASRFSPSNNQLRTSSNLRNQATIQDGRVIVQQVQGRLMTSNNITVLTTNTSYPSRKIRRICAALTKRPQRKQDQYAVSREDQYAILKI
ncbi:hypothetical protein Tco_0559161, partial [Tanacetum coccineum]